MQISAPPPPAAETFLVACLCADWCTTCRGYEALFDAAAADFGAPARFVWVDIEDHAEVLGDIDVETFPTLLIARGDDVLFFGPLTPQPAVLARTLARARDGELAAPATTGAAELARLPARVRALPDGA